MNKIIRLLGIGVVVMVAMNSYAADRKKRERDDASSQSSSHSPSPSGSPATSPNPAASRGRGHSSSFMPRIASLSRSTSAESISVSGSESSRTSSSGTSSHASSLAPTPSDPTVRPSISWSSSERETQQKAKKHRISTGSASEAGAGAAGLVMPSEPLTIAIESEMGLDEGSPSLTIAPSLQELRIQATAATLAVMPPGKGTGVMGPPLPPAAPRTEKKKLPQQGSGSSSDEDTELHFAIYSARSEEVASVLKLIEETGNINETNAEGDTPLHAAVKTATGQQCFHEIVKALIQKRANVNLLNKEGLTALTIAKMHVSSDSTIIQLLQEAAGFTASGSASL